MNATARTLSIARFLRAIAGDLPDPVHVAASDFAASLRFASIHDLREWAAYLDVTITAQNGGADIGQGHITYHRSHAMLLDGPMVELTFMEYANEQAVAS